MRRANTLEGQLVSVVNGATLLIDREIDLFVD